MGSRTNLVRATILKTFSGLSNRFHIGIKTYYEYFITT